MEMQQIRYFLALAETLNFTRAAEECHVTQPALTRAIQALEAELGGELIRREGRQSHLTELGRRMLPLMQQCHQAALTAKSLARAVKSSGVAPLPIVVSNSVNIELLVGPFTELFRAYPGAQIKIRRGRPGDVVEALKQGEADLAIAGPLGEAWERLDSWPLFEEPVDLAVNIAHRLAGRNGPVELADIKGEPLLNRPEWELGAELASALAAAGLSGESAHEAEIDEDLLALLRANAGIGFLPRSAPRCADVRRVELARLSLTRRISAYAAAGRPRSPVAGAMLNLLRANDWRVE
jgi:DNA-binding transcriptional LysR family regulator